MREVLHSVVQMGYGVAQFRLELDRQLVCEGILTGRRKHLDGANTLLKCLNALHVQISVV